MAKGDGSITEVKRGVWRVCVSFGKDPITGKRIKVQRNVHGSKVEARRVRDKIISEHKEGLRLDADKVVFGSFAREWHNSRIMNGAIANTTQRIERHIIDILCAYLEGVRLCDLTPQLIESLYVRMLQDRNLSTTTLNKYHVKLKQILKKAVDYDLLLKNPCNKVDAPKPQQSNRSGLSANDASRLLELLDNEERQAYDKMREKEQRQTQRGNLFGRSYLRGLNTISRALLAKTLLATGARLGEGLALTWGNVDFEGRALSIVATLTENIELKKPKSHAGIRTIAVDVRTLETLKEWKYFQQSQLLKLGIKQTKDTPVFCSEVGAFMERHNVEGWWREWRKAHGFNGLKLHELRHTQATQLLANGIDVKTVQTRLGHSNASLTLNWYAHALPENDQKAADLIGDLFSKKEENAPRIIDVKSA